MRIGLAKGVWYNGVNALLTGGGVVVAANATGWVLYFGCAMIGLGALQFAWGVTFNGEHWWKPEHRQVTLPYALMLICAVGFSYGVFLTWKGSKAVAAKAVANPIARPSLIDMWANVHAPGDSGGIGTSITVKTGSDTYMIPMYVMTNNENNTKYARFLIVTNFKNYYPINSLIENWVIAQRIVDIAHSSQILPGQEIADQQPMIFGEQVYIYTNGLLTIQEKYGLIEKAKAKQLNLVFRDFSFIANKWKEGHPIDPNLLSN